MPWRLVFLYASSFFYNVLIYMAVLEYVPAEDILTANAYFMVLASLGMVSLSLLYRRLSRQRRRNVLTLVQGINLISLAALFLSADSSYGWYLSLAVFLLSWGYIAACIFYLAARQVKSNLQGRFIGIALALANLGIGLCIYAIPRGPLYVVPVLGGFILQVCLLHRIPRYRDRERPLSPQPVLLRNLYLPILIAVMLGLMVGLDDSLFMTYFSAYQPTFAVSRLFTVASFLLAGVLADYAPVYLPLVALIAKVVPLFLRTSLPEIEITGLIPLLGYMDAFFTGVLIVFVIRLFLEVAVYTKHPDFWAAMGRGIEMPASAMGALMGASYLNSYSLTSVIIPYLALLLIVVALFYRGLLLYLSVKSRTRPLRLPLHPYIRQGTSTLVAEEVMAEPRAVDSMPKDRPIFSEWQERFGLTQRECEVLQEIIAQKSIAEIAECLCITERTVKYHIGNMLRKTNTKNQRQLRRILQES